MASTMRAWRTYKYNEDVPAAIGALKLETDVAVPSPGAGEVRVKVLHAAVNPIDWKLFSGGYHSMCPATFPYVPGFDLSGTVDAVGEGVSLAVGDTIIADTGLLETCVDPPPNGGSGGAFAEYAIVPEKLAAVLAAKIKKEDARTLAGLPLAGLTSYQALFTGGGASTTGGPIGDLKAGQKLLVLGGSSGTGLFAIQLAKSVGAHVACTASANKTPDGTSKLDLVKSMGADVIIDYKSQQWSAELAGQDYDMIYDCVGDNEDWLNAPKVLKEGGLFVSIANFTPAPENYTNAKFVNMILKSDGDDLKKMVKLFDEGKLKVCVDEHFAFDEVKEALSKSLTARSGGKLVIDVASPAPSESCCVVA